MTDNTDALPPLPTDALREALQRIVDWDAAGMALTENHIAQARAALAQRQQVPENATEPMQKAMQRAVLMRKSMNDVWRAALSQLPTALTAAPSAQAEPVGYMDAFGDLQKHRDDAFKWPVYATPPTAQAEPVRQLHSFSSIDCEKLIAATVPGGSACDPQEVADSIRRYLNAWPSAQAEPQVSLDIAAIRAACRAEALEEAAQRIQRDDAEAERQSGPEAAGWLEHAAAAIREMK